MAELPSEDHFGSSTCALLGPTRCLALRRAPFLGQVPSGIGHLHNRRTCRMAFCFPIFLAGHELCRLESESGYLSFAFLAIGRENLEGHMLLMDEPSVSMRLAQ